jgi:hypothetical protein
MYFPYVDVATCDRETLPEVRKAIARIPCPRRAQLLRNGHLELVAGAVDALPRVR